MAVPGGGPAGIFISYRRADASWPARWLADRLTGHFGAGVVFQDVDSIGPGDDFAAEIETAVGTCSVLLAVIGPEWLTAEGDAGRRLDDPQDWVRLEIEAAFSRGVRIVPVLADGARMPAANELPPSLRGLARRQAVSLSPASLDISKLVSVIETALAPVEESRQQAEKRKPERAQSGRSQVNRLLMNAVHDALTLTGAEKANAVSALIPAAVLAAPERVGWLIAEAETTARSILDVSRRADALGRVAGAVASADPERAETIARSIEDAWMRADALGRVARAVASADPERAETIARSIEDAILRAFALASVAGAVASADADRAVWLAAEAETTARSIEDAVFRPDALARVAGAVASADPERAVWLAAEAEAAARSIEDVFRRADALARVAGAVASADPERAETIARSIEDVAYRVDALARVTEVVASADAERGMWLASEVEAAVRSMGDALFLPINAVFRANALARVAGAVASADPERAETIARSIENATTRASALADVVRHLAQQENL
jgi:hypothetical protein